MSAAGLVGVRYRLYGMGAMALHVGGRRKRALS